MFKIDLFAFFYNKKKTHWVIDIVSCIDFYFAVSLSFKWNYDDYLIFNHMWLLVYTRAIDLTAFVFSFLS